MGPTKRTHTASNRTARRLTYAAGALAIMIGALVPSCSSEDPNAAGGDGLNNVAAYCATPNSGCECSEPGRVVDCGHVEHRSGDYVLCSQGKRTCTGGRWGACTSETLTTKYVKPVPVGGSVHGLALGTGAPCPATGPLSNACDPYCNQVIDDPVGLILEGGMTVVDGGLTIDPGAAEAGAGGVLTTESGITACGGAYNIVGPTCTPPGLTTCQQDFRCDSTTSQCLWNGGPGYFDPAAGGVDLTVGAPCGPSGSGAATAPVCNRGSASLPAGSTITFHVVGAATPPDGCSNLGPPTASFVLGGNLDPGACTNFNLGNSTGNKFITVNAGAPGAVTEAPGLCANNSAGFKDDGAPGCGACGSCNTTLTGTIRDPRGVNPLPNILVYVPSTPVMPLTDGVACDTCASLISGNPLTQTVTNFDGTFTLNNVPTGGAFPLVIMAGRWRRVVTVPAIPACGTAALAAASARLPRNKTEGNIPLTAVVMAQGDHLQCLIRKIGLDDAEFTVGGGTGRFHLYTHNGMTFSGATNGPTNAWGNAANLSSYSALLSPCDNNHVTYPAPTVPGPNTTNPPNPTANATARTNVKNFVDGGGRLFTTHWLSHDFVHLNWTGPGAPVQGEFGTNVDADREAPVFPYTIDTSTPIGNTLAQWGLVVGAATAGPPPKITFNSWRHLSKSVNTGGGAVRFTYGDSTAAPVSHGQNASVWGGPHVNMYQFDTPWGLPPASQCGRVVVSQSHVSSGSGSFPTGCGSAATAMTPQEKSFEFLYFNSQACLGLTPPPPPPPPPPPLPVIYYVRDYEGVCGVGEVAEWQYFFWQSITPPGTSIAFHAATADTQAALPPAPPPAAPGSVAIGTASGASILPPAWGFDSGTYPPNGTVATHLLQDPPGPAQVSKRWLRVYMTFNPVGSVAPTLLGWRQQYSCKPAE